MPGAIVLLWVAATCVYHLLETVSCQACNGTEMFVKVAEQYPRNQSLILLFTRPGDAITAECHQRCKTSQDCPAFLVNYGRSSCFRVISDNETEREPGLSTVVTAKNTNYFERSCLRVPNVCKNKLWVLERAPGYELVNLAHMSVPRVSSGLQCGQLCLEEKTIVCRSAQYIGIDKLCLLSTEDRRTQPDSYRATDWSNEYWENQCVPNVFPGQACSLEEYTNSTMCCADLQIQRLTRSQCQIQCENEESFTCRGSTFVPSSMGAESGRCLLHGDDTSSAGPRAVQPLQGATYLEKVPCLNLVVKCTANLMTVTLHTLQKFWGRLFVRGRSDQCNSSGQGGLVTSLMIPLTTYRGRAVNKCNVMMAYSVSDMNRTMLSAVVIVQHNAIIQRRGDRAIKVGCLLTDNSPNNVTLGASLSFGGVDSLSGSGTLVVNTSSVPPTVLFHITDRSSGDHDAKETQLGQDLELRIDVKPDNSSYDIRAVHLIASSEDGTESYLLLDQRGCPADSSTFPALRRATSGSKSLVANFRAFKFPRSNVVKFNVTVQFCPGVCQPVGCGQGILSYGRRKRGTEERLEGSIVTDMFQEMPLEVAIIVHTPRIVPSAILAPGNNTLILTAGVPMPGDSGEVCLHWGAVVGLVLAWLFLQVLLLLGCFITAFRRRHRPRDEHKLEDDFPGYENHRHVHWADQEN